MQTKWTRSGRIQEMQRNLNQISFIQDQKPRAREKARSVSPCHQAGRECTPGHPKGIRFVTVTTLGHASRDRHAHASMFACLCCARVLQKSSSDGASMTPCSKCFIQFSDKTADPTCG